MSGFELETGDVVGGMGQKGQEGGRMAESQNGRMAETRANKQSALLTFV